jgi:hypothetical protein
MRLSKRTRMYGTKCTLVLAVVTAFIAQAQARPTPSQDRSAQARRVQREAALPTDERHIKPQQKAETQPEDPWTVEQLLYPEALLKRMSSGQERPLLLHIGVAFLFKNGHIPRSTYVGPALKTEGIENLKRAVQEVPRDREIVLYCGCCPWKDCPNIRPAFKVLRELRFTNIRLLYLSTSFAQDWVEKGFPVEKG